jgi:hypothetical protein
LSDILTSLSRRRGAEADLSPGSAIIVRLTVNPAAMCSKMNQVGSLPERTRKSFVLEVLKKLEVMRIIAK